MFFCLKVQKALIEEPQQEVVAQLLPSATALFSADTSPIVRKAVVSLVEALCQKDPRREQHTLFMASNLHKTYLLVSRSS